METAFQLDNRLMNEIFFIKHLHLCQILLMDNMLFPWIILVPQKNNAIEIIDLSSQEQQTLMRELVYASNILKLALHPDKINIATFGNVVPQLHIHIIARFKDDIAWPKTVWNVEKAESYDEASRTKTINRFKNYFNSAFINEI